MKESYFEEIETLKKRFIDLYILISCCTSIVYIIIFYFIMYTPLIVGYLTIGFLISSYAYFLTKEKFSANSVIHGFMIISPLYNFYIMLTFWNNSVANIVSLFPLVLVSYTFFSIKIAVRYSIYLVANILICFMINWFYDFYFTKYSHDEIVFSDMILFIFNLIIIILLFIYNNKINKLKILIDLDKLQNRSTQNQESEEGRKEETTKSIDSKKTFRNNDLSDEIAEKLFEDLENTMTNTKIFKNSDLNISMLSNSLNINYTHLSKAIRYKGYQNFNHYLNTYRVRHVKKLIAEIDLNKITLMYIYSDSGFSNQATFNRVFKQIEGITPSEYINKANS
jgi:AraC-like DNA-binding protein